MTRHIKHSRKSIWRLLNFFFSLQSGYSLYHSTLTFSEPDFPLRGERMRRLNILLSFMCRRFTQAGVVWFGERQDDKGLHFHVLFLFFTPEDLPSFDGFSDIVFKKWNSLNGGGLIRSANLVKKHLLTYRSLYPTKHVVAAKPDDALEPERWWGYRNRKVLKGHMLEGPDKQSLTIFIEKQPILGPKRPAPLTSTERSRRFREKRPERLEPKVTPAPIRPAYDIDLTHRGTPPLVLTPPPSRLPF